MCVEGGIIAANKSFHTPNNGLHGEWEILGGHSERLSECVVYYLVSNATRSNFSQPANKLKFIERYLGRMFLLAHRLSETGLENRTG